MNAPRRSIFALAGGPRAKWIVLVLWVVGIVIAAGPANLPAKFSDAEENESTSFLPGDAESTKALEATTGLQGGELAPAVIVYRRESGLTSADRARIAADARGLTKKRFPGVVADGATAAAGGRKGGRSRSSTGKGGGGAAPRRGAAGVKGCAGPTSPVPGQPRRYSPFVGPICSPDGKAAIVTAYLRGNGDSSTLLDPIDAWRKRVSDPGGGLAVKITGGAGYSADAIKVFEGINGTLLLAAVLLVIVLLILIYRSPVFLFIPLVAVMFAETLSRSVGYGLSELGVTINGQSSSIMSILVLGAGTDYALLIVARYREELHTTDDPHAATRAAMRSAGPAVFASAATVITALFCLTLAKVNGTAGLGPIGAMGVACAAFSMLTLLPALLTIFGRRAFWPFVPHAQSTAPADDAARGALGRRIVDGSAVAALLPVIGASLLVLVLLPLALVTALLRRLVALITGHRVLLPSLVSLLDDRVFRPYELRRSRHERPSDATHGFWKRVGDRVGAAPRRVAIGSLLVLLLLAAGLGFFSTGLTTNDSYRTEVEAVAGQDLVSKSFPAGASVPTDVVVPRGRDVAAAARAVAGAKGVERVSPPVATGARGTLVRPRSTPSPIRPRRST